MPEYMPPVVTPEPVTPLGPEVTDMQVIEEAEEKKELIYETEEAKCVLDIIQEFERQEEFVRQRKTLEWKKNNHYWNNLQYLALDEVAHDWRTPEEIVEDDPQSDLDPALYAKIVNVYKAHGEILIGALTSGTPIVRFFPKDADDQEDVVSAKAHSSVAELVQKQNHSRLLLMKALFILYNQGLVAAYNENKSDYRFGSVKVPDYADVEMTNRDYFCPSCGAQMGSDKFSAEEYGPQGPMMEDIECPSCMETVQPEFEDSQEQVTQQVGEKEEPKNRECIEIYGPLNVKIPLWAKDQFSTPYLILETEESVGMLREIYPEIADRIQEDHPDSFDSGARIPTAYRSTQPSGLCTVQRVWLRKWAFNTYKDYKSEEVVELKKKYNKGCYAVIINKDLVAELLPDSLDDHWTISENPLSETLHAEPLGAPMIPLQDITNELTNLTLETIEFGIPEIFADSRVLDFDAYKRQELRPGQVSPASMPAGQNLSGGFHEVKASTLSREVESFADRIFNVSQFVMGSYPAIYGGAIEGSSRTAKEYELSKSSALQRLSTTWSIVQDWWSKVIAKSTRSFVKNLQADENYVKAKGSSFVNVWVRKSELLGQIGDVEPEVTETFPVSWTQKRDVILNLMQMPSEDIAAVLRHPENAGLIAQTIGVPELYIPGDDSRNKQLYEIARLVQQEPMEVPVDEMNPMGMQSSIPVGTEVDDHEVEAEICRAWLRSEIGLDAKETNPAGYMNVLVHLKEHMIYQQLEEASAASAADSEEQGGEEQITESGTAEQPA